VQGLSAVRVLNFSLRACASWPFWTAKPFESDEEGGLDGAGDPVEVVDVGSGPEGSAIGEGEAGDGGGDASLFDPEPEGVPGDDTWSVSCVPSAIGPDV